MDWDAKRVLSSPFCGVENYATCILGTLLKAQSIDNLEAFLCTRYTLDVEEYINENVVAFINQAISDAVYREWAKNFIMYTCTVAGEELPASFTLLDRWEQIQPHIDYAYIIDIIAS